MGAAAVSVLALVLAVAALAHPGDGGSNQAPAAAGATSAPAGSSETAPSAETSSTTTESTSTDAGTTPDESESSTSSVLPSGGAPYTLAKDEVHLRIPGGGRRDLDFDQPMVNSDSDATDATYVADYDRPSIDFGSTPVAIARTPQVTPDECANNIQLAPADASIQVSQDLVLCAVTNGNGAVNEPARAKMARIIVNTISESNVLNLTVTTWEIPR